VSISWAEERRPVIKTTIVPVPVPAPVAPLRKIIAAVDAPLIATPEYDGSVLGQLKNAIDRASGRRDERASEHGRVGNRRKHERIRCRVCTDRAQQGVGDGPSARVLAQAATRVLGRLIAPLATKRASQGTMLQSQTDTQWNAANTTP
jgi:NADPH-dependent FMN reductase